MQHSVNLSATIWLLLGSDETGTFYGRYCGVLSSLIIALPGPNAWLQFVTDDSIQDDGFIMSYTYHGRWLTVDSLWITYVIVSV